MFLTVCTDRRRPLLARQAVHELLVRIWSDQSEWMLGRYVLMPDHLHLFCCPAHRESLSLERWIRYWKSCASRSWPCPGEQPIWQSDHWDRQLRDGESYSEKWEYVRNNPVRAGLVATPEAWNFQGELTEFRFRNA